MKIRNIFEIAINLIKYLESCSLILNNPISGARTISTATAKLLFDKGYHFIDVRGLDDFKIGHIPGAYHLSIKSNFDEQNLSAIVKKTQPAVIYCNGILCMGSSIAIKKAIDWGWSNISLDQSLMVRDLQNIALIYYSYFAE